MSDITANLNRNNVEYDTTLDTVIIKKLVYDIPGGKTLDVTGVVEEVLKAGRIIIMETATRVRKPLKITAPTTYEALPSGHVYEGILVATILTSKPFAAILIGGDVNEVAIANYGLPAVPAAAKTALTHVLFTQD